MPLPTEMKQATSSPCDGAVSWDPFAVTPRPDRYIGGGEANARPSFNPLWDGPRTYYNAPGPSISVKLFTKNEYSLPINLEGADLAVIGGDLALIRTTLNWQLGEVHGVW